MVALVLWFALARLAEIRRDVALFRKMLSRIEARTRADAAAARAWHGDQAFLICRDFPGVSGLESAEKLPAIEFHGHEPSDVPPNCRPLRASPPR